MILLCSRTRGTSCSALRCVRARAASPAAAVSSVEWQALRVRLHSRYVPATEIGGEERASPECQVRRVAKEVGLLVAYQARYRPVGRYAEHLAGLVATDVQVALGIKSQAVRQYAWEGRDLLARSGRAIVLHGHAEDGVAEGLGHV